MLCKTLGLSFSPPLKNCSHFPFPDGLSKSPWHRYSFQNSEHHHIVQIPVWLFQTTLQKKKSTSLQTNLSDIPPLEKTNINFLKASLYKINPIWPYQLNIKWQHLHSPCIFFRRFASFGPKGKASMSKSWKLKKNIYLAPLYIYIYL